MMTIVCYKRYLDLETIDTVQCLIDKCNDDIPVIIMGDMNASIPKSDHIFPKWYKHKPYSKRSAILYEFLCDNNLSVGNYVSNYCMDYTYIKANHDLTSTIYLYQSRSPLYMSVQDSDFQCDSPDNVSDHLPVSVTVYVPKKVILTLLVPLYALLVYQSRFPFHGIMKLDSSSSTLKRSQEF